MLECGIQWKNNSMETEIQSRESGHYKIKSDGQDGDDWQGDIWAKTWNQWGWGLPVHPEDEHPGGSSRRTGGRREGGEGARETEQITVASAESVRRRAVLTPTDTASVGNSREIP